MTHPGIAMQQSVTDALTCHRICEEAITHCLQTGGAHADPDHVTLMLDCAEICRTAAELLVRGSRFSASIAALCADVCQTCATECARFTDDAHMISCAEACRRCAQSCRQVAHAVR